MKQISLKTPRLAERTFVYLNSTRHANGAPIAQVYGSGWVKYENEKNVSF